MAQVKKTFNDLPLSDRALLIAEFAQYLESMQYYNYWVHLYSMASHYIEVYFDPQTKQINNIKLIEYRELDKYLPQIRISK